MDENPDGRQLNDSNHNYRGGYQGPIHLPPSLERRIASDAAEMARAARASFMAEAARKQAASSAASAADNAVAFAKVGRGEVITGESDFEVDEIEKWDRSNDAARLRRDLGAARRHSPEIEWAEPERGGMRERIVWGMQAGSGETRGAAMSSTTQVDMLDAQRDGDKEEMEANAAWLAKSAKPWKVKREEEEEDDLRWKQPMKNKKPAFDLDGADERRLSPGRTPLPPSRAASVVAQVSLDSEALSTAATTSAGRAGLSTAFVEAALEAPRPAKRVSDEGYYSSKGERELLKVVRSRQATVKSLHSASQADTNSDEGGLVFLEVVSRTLGKHNQRRDRIERTERCEELLRLGRSITRIGGEAKAVLTRGPGYTVMEKEAGVVAQGIIEDYEQETKALVDRLIELSTAVHPPGSEYARVRPHDPMDRSTSAEEEKMREVDSDVTYEQNMKELERGFGKDMALECVGRLQMGMAPSGYVPKELHQADPAVRSRFLLNTLPVDEEDIYFRPPCLSQPATTIEQTSGSGRGRPPSGAVLDPSLIYQRYLPQSASGTTPTPTSTLGYVDPALSLTGRVPAHRSRPNSGTASVPASTPRVIGPAQPLTVLPSTYLPHPASGTASATPSTLRDGIPALPLRGPSHGSPQTSTRTMQDILDGVQGEEMDDLLNFNHEETNGKPLPSYALPSALPNADRFLNSSLLRQQANDSDGAERLSLEREVLASIAAMTGSNINETQDNEDAQAERSPIADRPAYQAAIHGAKILAQGLADNYAKEMREKTMKERDERILKRARQISGQHPHLQAPRGRGEGGRVASQGVNGNDIARSERALPKTLRPLELSGAGRQRLSGLREDEREADKRSGALPDLADPPHNRYLKDWTQPQPWLTPQVPHPGLPSGRHAALLVENRRVSSAAPTSREKKDNEGKRVDSAENDLLSSIVADAKELSCTPGILSAAGVRKCTTFRPIYIHSARCDGCRQGNKTMLYSCNTCGGQWDSGCMDRDEIHNGRGLDWTDHGAQNNPSAGRVKWNRELHPGMDAVERLTKGFMAAAEQSVSDVEKMFNDVLDSPMAERLPESLPHGPLRSAYNALKPLIAEGRASISLTSHNSLDGVKKKEGASADGAIRLAYEEVRREAQSRWNAKCCEDEDEDDDEDQDLPGMTHQEVALERLAEEFRRDRLGTKEPNDDERKDDPEAIEVWKRLYEDYCREKAEAAKSSAWQTKYIPAWQGSLGRSGTDEAPRPPPPSRSNLAELSKAEAAASAARIAVISSRKDLKKDTLDSLADRIKPAKLSAARLKAKASHRLAEKDAIPSSSNSGDSHLRFPKMFLLSLDTDMINLAGAFQQDPAVQDLTRSQFFELLERMFPELWKRWKKYCSDPLYMEDTGSEVGKEGVGKEQKLRERVEERSKRYEDGMRKAMDRSVQDRGAGKGKHKEKPNLSIATSRTITDMELQIERAKAFNEGNMAAFMDMEAARKKGFEEGVKSAMGQQSSSVAGRSRGEGNKSSAEGLKDTIKKASKMDSLDTQAANAPIAVNGKPAEDKTGEHEEVPLSHDPYWFWAPIQFNSSASDIPRNFPWRSDGLTCELFGIMSPTTLRSLLSSLEEKVKKELEAMKVSEADPAAAAAGVAGLAWLADRKISGLTVLWDWRRENYPTKVGAAAMPFVRTPSLRTHVTERNVDGALWMMSEERGHLLLVHAAKREEGDKAAEKTGEENNSSQEKGVAE